MSNKKYPIGTKIKYIGYCKKCKGKIGKVVNIWDNGYNITLPQSLCTAAGPGKSIICSLSDIIPVSVKNQQLLFAFME